jgi:hypothetical protein
VDTVVTAFTYDTLNKQFYVTQTDFFSYNTGRIYDRAGNRIDTLMVGYSPEVIQMFYNQSVGIDDFKAAEEFAVSVYPNPTTDFVNINFEQGDFNQFRILDINGKIVLEKSLIKKSNRLNVSDFPKGMYLIELGNADHRTAKPLIIK